MQYKRCTVKLRRDIIGGLQIVSREGDKFPLEGVNKIKNNNKNNEEDDEEKVKEEKIKVIVSQIEGITMEEKKKIYIERKFRCF